MAIEVRPATGHWEDFASFMVPRKPGAGGCVCMSYRDARLDMPGRIDHMRTECAAPPGPGVLAYRDGEVAGWCSIAPKASQRRLMASRTLPHVDEDLDPWSIVCFVVRPPFRRQGLMHDLLEGAVGHARAHGAVLVEGYPVDVGDRRVDAISGYVGTVSLFEQHGFHRVQPTSAHSGHELRWLMRRDPR